VPAVAAAQAHEAVGEDAALEKGIELVTHKLRQVGASRVLSLPEESGGVLLHQAVQRGLLRSVALVVDRGAVRHPDRRFMLPADGLHARPPRL